VHEVPSPGASNETGLPENSQVLRYSRLCYTQLMGQGIDAQRTSIAHTCNNIIRWALAQHLDKPQPCRIRQGFKNLCNFHNFIHKYISIR